MKNKIFLTSAITICTLCPAIAETFPGDGNMLENKTYTEAAVYDNTGIYEGTVVANADYSLNPYSVAAGSYLTGIDNNNDATTSTCTSGNYCPGVASTTFDNNAFGDTGLKACPANYSGSAAGATANTDCYRACSTTDVAKSATVSGQMYYNGTSGDGVNACGAETCVSGWHVKAGLTVRDVIATAEAINSAYVLSDPNASMKSSNTSQDGFSETNFGDQSAKGRNYYGITDTDTFVIDYGDKGLVYGKGICSTHIGQWNYDNSWNITGVTTASSLTDETGQEGAQYCYCKFTGYKSSNNASMQTLTSDWIFREKRTSDCSISNCTHLCSVDIVRDDSYGLPRRSLSSQHVDNINLSSAICEANTINITWNDASAEDIAATGAATTVYEGDIKTPLKAVTKPGKTFVGWKFVKPAATPVEP